MDVSRHLLFAFLGGLALVNLVRAQGQLGFISLDCGLPANTSYIEPTLTLNFTSDADYINSGVSKSLSHNYQQRLPQQYHHVRSFPQGRRNCYNISVENNTNYLMRASFLYGNYDGLGQLPKFDIYFGDSLWGAVTFTDESTDTTIDSIHVTSNNQVQICLVNTNNGTPFISTLEFRPLPNNTYQVLTRSLLLYRRYDYGTTENTVYRFPDDIYDRFWTTKNDPEWGSISTAQKMDSGSDYYQPAYVVMKTAATQKIEKKPIEIEWEAEDENTEYYVYMHFAEVVDLNANNNSRGFNVTYNGSFWYGPIITSYLNMVTLYTTEPITTVPTKKYPFSFVPIENSTLPPIINAIEIYSVINLSELTSDQGDVDAIESIKSTYGIVKDWEGDPCVPRAQPWEGINCTDGTAPRIVSLNLSTSGLTGKISPMISNLEMLQILDFSNNDLTGNIPDFLSNLSNLIVLKLDNNKFTGSVPSELVRRFNSGSLQLSVQGNPDLECISDSCKSKKNNVIIPIVASIGGLVVIAVIATAVFWIAKWRKRGKNETGVPKTDSSETNNQLSDLLDTKRRQFTYSEVLKMTSNFERILGRGGFGMVYYGLIDNTQVAVKILSQASGQGYQQFQAEVTLLLRVHHKNLTDLVGYLNEGDRLGLIYEFMANGNLAEHLSEKSSHVLSWQDRLRIAMDAAQGLEYLHDGCKPPIIHRDVKTTNILLTENFQAKLADFGLSKSFPTDGNNSDYMSTTVAGTPGYLDPEYYISNRLTEKSDVYSFGIALLEIISCRAVISRSEENSHISKWANAKVAQGDINGIVDERLRGQYDVNSVWKAVEIAMSCLAGSPSRRPAMGQVVAELKNCLAMELERTPESRGFDSTNSANMMSIVMDYGGSVPMAR